MLRDPKPLPSREELLAIFRYDPETGKIYWRERTPDMFPPAERSAESRASRFNRLFAGKEIGTINHDGYIRVSIWFEQYMAHRIVWKMAYGDEPEFIDHINGVAADNRLSNLRSVPRTENMRNRTLSRNNKSGTHGVYWDKDRRKWRAQIQVNQKHVYLGLFESLDAAAEARRVAEVKHDYHKNHGRGR